MKPEWWTNGKACSRIPRVIEIWREQGCEVTPLYSGAALLDAHQRGRHEGMEEAFPLAKQLEKSVFRAEENAGTMPARQAVKLRPNDWHRVTELSRALFEVIRAKAQEVKT